MGIVAAGIMAGGALVGSGISAYGASKQADAMQAAEKQFQKQAKKFSKEAQAKTSSLEQQHLADLTNLDQILAQSNIFGAGTSTQQNLYKSLENFSAVAAGDTSAFEDMMRQSMQDTLANTKGTAIGTFANVAAQDRMQFMTQSLQNAQSTAGFLSQLSTGLAQTKFGVQDQAYNNWANIEQFRIGGVAQSQRAAAQQVGIPYAALGQTVSQAVQAGGTAYMQMKQLGLAEDQSTAQQKYIGQLGKLAEAQAQAVRLGAKTGVNSALPTNPGGNVNSALPDSSGSLYTLPSTFRGFNLFPLQDAWLGSTGVLPPPPIQS